MKNDNTQAKHHRGSSPPFQDPEQDFYEWLNGLKSIGQHDEKASAIRIAEQPGKEKTESNDLNNDSRWTQMPNPGKQSFDDGESHQGRGDESRWQDDGGKGGGAV